MTLSKPPLSIEKQLSLLKQRRMSISNDLFAKDCLKNIGYYRLSGYWYKFQDKSQPDESFLPGTSFEEIIELYRFDTKLRSLVFDAIEKIEISFSTHLNNYMSCSFGVGWYIRSEFFADTEQHAKLIKDISYWIDKNRDKLPVKSYRIKHPDDECLPFWIVALVIPLGTLSKLFGLLKECHQKEVAKQFEMTGRFLVSCMRSLTTVRNNCAHYNRLWDFRLPLRALRVKNPTKLSRYNYTELTEKNDQDFFAPFYIISLFLCVIAPDSKFCSLTRDLIGRYIEKTNSKLTYGKMGFPTSWEKLPLFERMLKNESKMARVRTDKD